MLIRRCTYVLSVLSLLAGCEATPEPPPQPEPKPAPQPELELQPLPRPLPPDSTAQLQPLKPLPPETLQQLAKYSQQQSVSYDALDPTTRAALRSSCPALSEMTAEVGGEVITTLADGSKAELPVQILVGVGKIVVKHKQDEICELVTNKLADQ